MKKNMIILFSALMIINVSQLSFAQTVEFRYAVFDLGDFGGSASNAFGINDAGIVVGNAWFPGNFIFHTALFDVNNGTITDLGTLGGQTSWAYEINEQGQIVGVSDGIDGLRHPYLWDNGSFTDLGSFGGSNGGARSINEQDQITGYSQLQGDDLAHAFRWSGGVLNDLGSLLNNQSISDAWDINEAGDVVGLSYNEITSTAILWENGNMFDLGGLGGPFQSEAWAINDFGNIAGWSLTANNKRFAVIWDGKGGIMNLNKGNGRFYSSLGFGMNNQDQVVGAVFLSRNGDGFGMLWEPATGMHILDELMPPIPEMKTWTAYDINNHGQIAAWGMLKKSGWFRALMLSPVDPEMTLSDPVPGVAGALNTIVARGGNLKAGSVVSFYWGVEGGGTLMLNCNMLDAVLQIENARFAGSAVADGNGVATLEGMVPPGAQGQNILFQAVTGPGSPTGCAQSQLVIVKFK